MQTRPPRAATRGGQASHPRPTAQRSASDRRYDNDTMLHGGPHRLSIKFELTLKVYFRIYEIIRLTLDTAGQRAQAVDELVESTTPALLLFVL